MRLACASFFLVAIAAATSCARHPATGVTVDPVFRTLIAPDTKALAGAALDKLKTTPLYRRHEKSLDFPLLDASSERLGVDPRRDISDLAVEWNGGRAVFLGRGRFNPATVEQKLRALGARPAKVGKYSLFDIQQNALAFLGRGVVVEGSVDGLNRIIRLEDKGDGEVPEELAERLRLLPKGSQIWAVSRGGLPFAELPMRSDYASALSNIAGYVSGASLGIEVDTGAHVAADLTCVSAQGAERVRDGLRAAVAIGRLTTKDDQQDLLKIYDSIRVDQDREIVRMRADFPQDLADLLLASLPELPIGPWRTR